MDESKKLKSEDYVVGYGKPPKHTQFKKRAVRKSKWQVKK